MLKTIKEYQDLLFVFGLGLILLAGGILMISEMIDDSASAAQESVEVTATVEETLTFTVSPTSTALTPSLVDNTGNTHVGSSTNIVLVVTTNRNSYSITASGTYGGLYNATASDTLIETVTGNELLTEADDDDDYGLNATSTSSGEIEINYDNWGTLTVGEIPTSAATLIDDPNTPGTVTTTIKIYAECDSGQDPGSYNDTILLTATGGS
jgi:hypothetical protein